MSKAPDSKAKAAAASPPPQPTAAAPPPPPRNSPLNPPRQPGLLAGRRLDPAAIMIGIGGLVLVLAVWWLLVTPRSSSDAAVDPARVAQIEQRLTALDGVRGEVGALGARVQAVQPLEGRVHALEERPRPVDIRPLETQLAALTERLAGLERNTTGAGERDAAVERRVQALEAKPAIDPATLAPREAVDALNGRIERLTERLEAQAKALEAQGKTLDDRLAEAARAAEQRQGQQDQALQQRLGQLDQAAQQRGAALEQTITQRLTALEGTLTQRMTTLEQAQARIAAIEGRTARLAAVDGLRGALLAGQPLGDSLGRLGQGAPPALTRFAQVAPPTESSLRLSFEDAAKAARAASDAAQAPDGSRGGVVDSALARLGGLVTVRRGDQVVWGDAAEGQIERARRALEAGDIEMSLTEIDKLPPPARAAMQNWAEQARALVAARSALRQLAAG
ncbi:hypothetical protein JMJ55_01270 [Belnapia sp. T6]|uniref:Chromosome partition protein Smc n=1 Tax=Belnapia mucosa TaxID=2804532 RepID=A0ABS1UWT4_9PROT|nr:hypothetical protein [Belnapia mucosa]MBL6453930.1 hypothetical protein [Belnapia mucosa]